MGFICATSCAKQKESRTPRFQLRLWLNAACPRSAKCKLVSEGASASFLFGVSFSWILQSRSEVPQRSTN